MIYHQINLVVRDVQTSCAFYRLLGIPMQPASHAEWAPHHASAQLSNGATFELDSVAFAAQWDPGLRGRPHGPIGGVIFFEVPSREQVDEVFARMTKAGHRAHKEPEDAFWGARYAIVEDPDGHAIGITSAIDPAMRRAPPQPPGPEVHALGSS